MRRLLPLLAVALLAPILSISSASSPEPDRAAVAARVRAVAAPVRAATAPRVRCERPGSLRLRRFEDRSARLECAGRVLVRVSVPG